MLFEFSSNGRSSENQGSAVVVGRLEGSKAPAKLYLSGMDMSRAL